MKRTELRYGIVGGGRRSFISNVHRKAVAFGENAVLTAGCFSRREEENRLTGEGLGIDSERIYADFETMAREEAARQDGIDWVSICAPNDVHYAAAKAFLQNGIHVYCEKPMTFTAEEAEELVSLAEEKGLLFGVNYSHSGNVMVKEAREIVKSGQIGEIVNVNAEYLQEYLVNDIGKEPADLMQMPSWRKDPEKSGGSNCVGDIGSHIEHTVGYITGLKLKRVCAVLDRFGQALDINANILVEYENGAHGTYAASQVCIGHMNGLVVRIYGTKGALEWVQENPNVLYLTLAGQPTQILNRGTRYMHPYAASLQRLPSGHPEGLYEAFANMYRAFTGAVLKKANREPLTEADLDFPTAEEGARGVRFVNACLRSDAKGSVWEEV